MKKQRIFSRFFQDTFSKKYTLSELAQYVSVFYFNMRTVHFHTQGKEFLELHRYAESLYVNAEDYYDDLVEMALSFEETVQPMFVFPGDNPPITDVSNFNGSDTVSVILNSVRTLFDRLEMLNKDVYPAFVQSKIDSILELLDKQNYKLQQMSKEI